jgi:Rieske Fe-S protein
VSAVCPHLGGIVTWNDSERSWDCPLHGSRFAADGTVLEGPAVEPLAPLG